MTTTQAIERTGFLNIRQVYHPHEVERRDKSEFLDHMRKRMRFQMGEKIIERLADGRAYVVRIWEGEIEPRGSILHNLLDDRHKKDTTDSEVPDDTGVPGEYGQLWTTALMILQNYQDAHIGEYVGLTEQQGGKSTLFIPYKVEALNRDEFDVMRFGVVKFRLPGHEMMRAMKREL